MSTTTTNLGLTKPAGTETVSLSVINNNYDIIDAVMTFATTSEIDALFNNQISTAEGATF